MFSCLSASPNMRETTLPEAMLDTAIYQLDNEYIFDELIYRRGLFSADIYRLAKQQGYERRYTVYADSADPKAIAELRLLGMKVSKADKGGDGIAFGIQRMQEKRINITRRSTNLIEEFRSYKWADDKNGKSTNTPIDAHNHGIDGIRYYFTTTKKATGRYFTGGT